MIAATGWEVIINVWQDPGPELCLIGNVNCGLLDTETDQQCVDSARYALQQGMPAVDIYSQRVTASTQA